MALKEKITAGALNGLLQLPDYIKRRLLGRPVQQDGFTLDTDMQLLLALARIKPSPPLDAAPEKIRRSRQSMRESARSVAGKPVSVIGRDLNLTDGQRSVAARLYQPAATADALLVFFHGGGWAQGDLESHDHLCRYLATETGAQVLAVDYRLAPEHPWPAALEDAWTAYHAAVAQLPALGVNTARIALAGDSAGANLATVLARKLAQENILQPRVQLLIYPATDASREHPSKTTFADGFLLTLNNIRRYEAFYIPSEPARSHPDISPLLAPSFDGMAPAVVVTAGFDPLRDEGRRYADRLEQCGVAVVRLEYGGLIHGFANMLCSDAVRNALSEMSAVVRFHLLTPPAAAAQ